MSTHEGPIGLGVIVGGLERARRPRRAVLANVTITHRYPWPSAIARTIWTVDARDVLSCARDFRAQWEAKGFRLEAIEIDARDHDAEQGAGIWDWVPT